ncbi:MAG: TetR-like C-terminal domain-containing protein [Eggerthella lenta]
MHQFDFIAGGIVSMLKSWLASDRRESIDTMVALADSPPQRAGRHVLQRNLALAERPSQQARRPDAPGGS